MNIIKKLEIAQKYHEEIYASSHGARLFRELYKLKGMKLVEYDFSQRFHLSCYDENYALKKLENQNEWITYEHNAHAHISKNKDDVFVHIYIYNKDRKERFSLKLHDTEKRSIDFFKFEINLAFNRYIQHLYEREQQEKKRLRMEELSKEVLGDDS